MSSCVAVRFCFRFAFMEFKNADEAMYALNAMNGHPFDARHTFLINRFTDIERYTEMDEAFVEPEPEQYQPKVFVLPHRESLRLMRHHFLSGASAGVARRPPRPRSICYISTRGCHNTLAWQALSIRGCI